MSTKTIHRDVVQLDVLQLEDWLFADPYGNEDLKKLHKVVKSHVKHVLHEATEQPLEVVLIGYSENGLAEIASKETFEAYQKYSSAFEETISDFGDSLKLTLTGVRIPSSFIIHAGETATV